MGKIKGLAIILIILLLYSINVYAEGNRNIEIFDINQGKVVKILESDSVFQREAINYLRDITGIFGKCDPIPSKGYAIRIPLMPSQEMQGQWINGFINEVIIVFPEEETTPFLMVFENEDRLLCFTFSGDTDTLLKNLKFVVQRNRSNVHSIKNTGGQEAERCFFNTEKDRGF